MQGIRKSKHISMVLAAVCAAGCLGTCDVAQAWDDQSHMAIARAAGLKSFHNACTPDVTKWVMKINNYGDTADKAHFFDAKAPITREDVYKQLEIMETHKGMQDGYVLGAVIHTMRCAKEATEQGQPDEYYYDVLAHYIGDMVQPLHMSAYDEYNKKYHLKFDMVMEYDNVKWDVDGAVKIARELKVDKSLKLENEDEVIDYMVALANETYQKAGELRKENRLITRKEALVQASKGATFLRAVMRYCGKAGV